MNLFFGICGTLSEEQILGALARVRSAADAYPIKSVDKWRVDNAGFLECSFASDEASLNNQSQRSRKRYSLVAAGKIFNESTLHGMSVGNFRKARHSSSNLLLAKIVFDGGSVAKPNLDGEVAYAVWDAQAESLYVQRDYFGVVPFYYYHAEGVFCFSNELRLIFASVPKRFEWNLRCIMARIQALPLPTSETSYAGIFKLPAASDLVWSAKAGVKVKRYYDLSSQSVSVSSDFHENSQHLSDLLFNAVRKRLGRTMNVAVELSGGLDSSAISGILEKQRPGFVKSFSAVFPGMPVCDESDYITSVVDYQGLSNKSFDATSLDLLGYFEESVNDFREIHYAANIHIARYIQDLALAAGCGQVYNGIDGDNVASHGMFHLKELADAGSWAQFCKELTIVSGLYSKLSKDPVSDLYSRFGRLALEQSAVQAIPVNALYGAICLKWYLGIPLRASLGRIRRIRNGSWEVSRNHQRRLGRFFSKELNQDAIREPGYVGHLKTMESVIALPQTERESQVSVLSRGVNENYFELIYSLSAKRGLHTICPFMDRDVVEFCINVPAEHKLRKGWNRAFLRKGLEFVYPEKVAWRRSKSNLGPAAYRVFKKQCVDDVEAGLHDPSASIWALFDRKAVKDLIGQLGAAPNDDRRLLNKIWVVWATAKSLDILSD